MSKTISLIIAGRCSKCKRAIEVNQVSGLCLLGTEGDITLQIKPCEHCLSNATDEGEEIGRKYGVVQTMKKIVDFMEITNKKENKEHGTSNNT